MGNEIKGAAVGGAVHPIMLDKLFNEPFGFHNGVRVSAILNDIKIFSHDAPYVLTALGRV